MFKFKLRMRYVPLSWNVKHEKLQFTNSSNAQFNVKSKKITVDNLILLSVFLPKETIKQFIYRELRAC